MQQGFPAGRYSEFVRQCGDSEYATAGELFLSIEACTFVSYSRDDLEFASRLAQDLKRSGAQVWMDKLDIHPGQIWERALEQAVTDCSCLLVILSPAAVESENVTAEVAFALDEKKEIIPVLYRDCKIPFRLRPIQYIDFREERGYPSALRELLRTLGIEDAPAEVAPIERRRYPLWVKIGLALTVLAAAGWGTYSIWSRGGSGPAASEPGISHSAAHVSSPRAAIPKSGWALGTGGVILHTEDGGVTWSVQRSGIAEHMLSASFLTPRIGWVIGGAGALLNTVDGGATWTDLSAVPKQLLVSTYKHSLDSVVFASAQSGWLTGGDGAILHTEDGGGHWTRQDSGTGETLYCAVFPELKSGWIVGSAGTVLHTANGGENWNPQNGGTDHTLFSAAFPTPISGWAVGTEGTIVHTADAGINWKAQASGTENELISVAFPTASSGWAVGGKGTILHTADGGASWSPQSDGVAVDLHSVWFADPLWGWAAGRRGVLLHTEDGGASWKLLQPDADANLLLYSIIFR
jgi:photosystem II stability/assembly factor-like uncharacterized protein